MTGRTNPVNVGLTEGAGLSSGRRFAPILARLAGYRLARLRGHRL